MNSIYIHIPFCAHACSYCNFYFNTSLKNKHKIVETIVSEIKMQKNFFEQHDAKIQTIYFGGGTPSLLDTSDLCLIIKAIDKTFLIDKQKLEMTIEANPDDVYKQKISEWTNLGFNRISLGVQSFYEKDLQYLGRKHSANESLKSIDLILESGIKNFSVDLIYGIPSSDTNTTEKNLEILCNKNIPHLSCYCLTVEPQTRLKKQIEQHKCEPIFSEQQAKEFFLVANYLSNKNYEQYEISNFSLPNYRSQHNSNYWKRFPYLGLGPSAHSYKNNFRFWNIANNQKYIQAIENKILPNECESLTLKNQYNEYVMIGLRQIEGLDLEKMKELFGVEFFNHFLIELQKQNSGHYVLENNKVVLSLAGKLFCDKISSELFLV